jgi:IS30 family transposase
MGQTHTTTNPNKGKHFTLKERQELEILSRHLYPGKKKPNFAELGRRLGKDRSTISREWKRGAGVNLNSHLETIPVYIAQKGQDEADKAAQNKGPVTKLTQPLARKIDRLILDKKYSPYAVSIRLKKDTALKWTPCERYLYNAIDAGLLSAKRSDLPYKREKTTHRAYPPRMAYNNARGRSIDERPAAANDRSEYGHWEGDLVVSGKDGGPDCLLVLTERLTRREVVRKVADRSQRAVRRALDRLEREAGSPFKGMKTLTLDNGCEFLDVAAVEQSCLGNGKRCDVYYAHPYRASERGSNENANRILRRFVPKGFDISKLTSRRVRAIEAWMNALPRKLHDGLSAAEKVQLQFKEKAA